jgi:hypothetical protein
MQRILKVELTILYDTLILYNTLIKMDSGIQSQLNDIKTFE